MAEHVAMILAGVGGAIGGMITFALGVILGASVSQHG